MSEIGLYGLSNGQSVMSWGKVGRWGVLILKVCLPFHLKSLWFFKTFLDFLILYFFNLKYLLKALWSEIRFRKKSGHRTYINVKKKAWDLSRSFFTIYFFFRGSVIDSRGLVNDTADWLITPRIGKQHPGIVIVTGGLVNNTADQ